ncbi:hypothetical protein Vafri_9189 [Volvox africanus]|nr:hypothetical protein Vafri_9189 [Volvox africanus]
MYGMMFTVTYQPNVSETSSYLMAADSSVCDISGTSGMGTDLTNLVVPIGMAAAAAALSILNMDPEDVRAVVLTTSIALTSFNKAYDILMPYSYIYRTVLDNMALEALTLHGITGAATAAATAAPTSHLGATASDDPASASSVTLASVTSPLAATSVVSEAGAVLAPWSTLAANGSVRFQAVFEEFPYPNILKQAYLHALPPVGENVTVVQQESKSRTLLLNVGLPLIISLGCSVLALIVATVVILRMLRNRRLKVVRPPGPGPATTLVVSDIQNSTLLWEVLPSGVMDVCLGIHHSIIRKHLVETRGYELSTEGDAFAVAFLCPSDALAFAMDTQVALLHADWPPSLLEQVDGCELWVQPSTDPGNRLETGGSQELGPTRGSSVAWWRENSDAVPLNSPLQLGRGGSTAVRPLPSRVVQLRSGGTLVSGTSDGCSGSAGEGVAALGVRQIGSISAEGGSTVNEVNGSATPAAVRSLPGIVTEWLDADGDSECAAVLPKDTGKKAAATGDGVMRAAAAEGGVVEDDNSVAAIAVAAKIIGGSGKDQIPTQSRDVIQLSTIEASGDADNDLQQQLDWRLMVTWDTGLTAREDAAAAASSTSARPGLPLPPRIRTSMSLDSRLPGVLEAKLPHNDAMPSTCPRPLGNARRGNGSGRDSGSAGGGTIPLPTVTPGSVKSAIHGTQSPRSGSLRRLIREITFRSYRRVSTMDLGTNHHERAPLPLTAAPAPAPAPALVAAAAVSADADDVEIAAAAVAAPTPAPAPLPKNSSTLVEPACSTSRSMGEPGERFLTPFTAPGRGQPVFDALWHSVNAAGAQLLQSRGFGLGSESGRPSDLAFDDGVPDAGGTSAQWLSVEALLRQLYSSARPISGGKAAAITPEVLPLASGAAFSEKAGGLRPPPQLVLRGLRVRMGIHADLQETEVTTTLRDGVTVTTYTGEFMATCKDICDSAMGGVVLLSGRAFQRYQELRHRDADSHSRDVMLLNLGEHVLQAPGGGGGGCEDGNPYGTGNTAIIKHPIHDPNVMQLRVLYCAVSPALMPRMAVLPSLVRTFRQVVPGCLSAPAAAVAPVFCNVEGIESLLAWEKVLLQNQMLVKREGSSGSSAASGGSGGKGVDTNSGHRELAATAAAVEPPPLLPVTAAMELLRRCANDAAQRLGGYLVAVSGDAGHWVLVFGSPESAILWGLEMLEAMLAAEWPEGFLDHDLTEEVWRDGVLTKRGLRLRIGIDFGRAMVRLVPRTGKLDYVGRPMNRAARIAAKAKAASMLVSGAAWGAVRPPLRKQLTAVSLGKMQLKGVAEQLELLAISWNACPARAGGTNSKDDGKERKRKKKWVMKEKEREETEFTSVASILSS